MSVDVVTAVRRSCPALAESALWPISGVVGVREARDLGTILYILSPSLASQRAPISKTS